MSAEPLWRVKTKPFTNSDRSYIEFAELNVPGFTEVEVWRAGDRTPTREQIRLAVEAAAGGGVYLERIVDAVLALLHGQGDEPRA